MKLRLNPATGRLAERVPAELAYADGTVAVPATALAKH